METFLKHLYRYFRTRGSRMIFVEPYKNVIKTIRMQQYQEPDHVFYAEVIEGAFEQFEREADIEHLENCLEKPCKRC